MDQPLFGGDIYRITCLNNGRVYIGSTIRSPRQRWLEHLHYLRAGTHHSRHLQKVFNKHGEPSLSFEVVERVEDAVFLQAREQFHIWRCEGFLMNAKVEVTPGVDFTEEVRAKMSASRRARVMKPMSEETKEKISKANSGKKRTPEHIAKTQEHKRAWIEQERPQWQAMLDQGMSVREVERITGRSRKMIARECRAKE